MGGEIVVVGAGGIGGMIAARLSRAGERVRLVVRPGRAERYQHGITVRDGDGETWSTGIEIAESIAELRPADTAIVVIATKAFDTAEVVRALLDAGLDGTPVVCAQNTTVNEPIVSRVTRTIAGMVVYFGADTEGTATLVDRGDPLAITLGSYPDGVDPWVEDFAARCKLAGFVVTVTPDVGSIRWNKLVLNLDSALSAICSVTNTQMRSEEELVDFRRAVRHEAEAVLAAAGVRYAPLAPVVRAAPDLSVPDSYSSTWHDLAQRRGRVETSLLNGEIVRLGALTGVATPYNSVLTAQCLEMAATEAAPGLLTVDELRAQVDADRARPRDVVTDPHRPSLHLMPPNGWLNDPNGPFLRDGEYHLFFQYNPHSARWERPHWAHASSTDLSHWDFRGVALRPGPDHYDQDGCFSGCVVDDDGTPTIVYTGVEGAGPERVETTCLARGDDLLEAWTKEPSNPVARDPHMSGSLGFRDPFVWRDATGDWLKIVGSGSAAGGSLLLFRSPDLLDWTFVSTMFTLAADGWPGIDTGTMWECPQLVSYGGTHLLIFSIYRHGDAVWFAGDFDGRQFAPRTGGLLDHGHGYFAPAVLVEPAGRTLVWGWCRETRSDSRIDAAGWAGVMSLPRELRLGADGHPRHAFAGELTRLRAHEAQTIAPARAVGRTVVARDARRAELRLSAAVEDAPAFALQVLASPDGTEGTVIRYDGGRAELVVDRTNASRTDRVAGSVLTAPLRLDAEGLDLHVIVDHSLVEIIANERVSLTFRVYPDSPWATACTLVTHREAPSVAVRHWPLTARTDRS